MKRTFVLLSSLIAAFAATSACSVERSSSVLGPSATTAAAGKTTSAPSMIGTWVVTGPSTSSVTPSSSVSALPDFSSCRNFTWEVTTQTASAASGRFSAECATGLVLSGTITGTLGNPTSIPIVVNGTLNRGSDVCAFSLTGEGTPIDSVTFHITYAGSTCLGPLQGSNTLSLAPHSAPAPSTSGYTLTGALTDGTSGGVLPGIEVRAGEFLAVRTDGAGHYSLPGVPAGAVTIQFAAAGYVTQTKPVTMSADAVLDTVLQRVAVAAPPPPSSGSGDQIDLHAVIVRGPAGDVASWPVTTSIRVIDANFGGWFVDFSAKNSWPEVVPPGWDGGIQYTLWIVERINGQWITAGGVEYWRGLSRQGGPPSRLAGNWYYNAGVWGELAGHQPAPGEQVGMFVTAGDQRAKDVRAVTERSNVVLLPFPTDGGGYFPF